MWGQWNGTLNIVYEGREINATASIAIDKDQASMGLMNLASLSGPFVESFCGASANLTAQHPPEEKRHCEWSASLFEGFDERWMSKPIAQERRNEVFVIRATLTDDQPHAGASTLEGIVERSGRAIGNFRLYGINLDDDSPNLEGTVTPWDDYRAWALREGSERPYLYRGHKSNRYKIVSAFHRSNRRNLARFQNHNVFRLAQQYEDHTGKTVDLKEFSAQAGLLSLAQHYGYPTPFIDWTASPFVAAYFAFESHRPLDRNDTYVRIFAVDHRVIDMNPPPWTITDPRQCLCVTKLPAQGNLRSIYQQSVFMLTNVPHVESFIRHSESQVPRNTYHETKVFDISREECSKAMKDLHLMNITAATLYQGLEGLFKYFAFDHYGPPA